MKKTMNITTFHDDLARYRDAKDLEAFYRSFHLDGLEVMPGEKNPAYELLPGQVIGVHMRCAYNWLDLWQGDTEALNKEYGSRKIWTQAFGGSSREVLLDRAREDLDFAKRTHAEYVVFHVSNIRTSDIFTYSFDYSDSQVLDAAAQMINQLLFDVEPTFYFLAENLWWPGMNLRDPGLTEEFLEKIHYPKKGIMLDTGHFLHTNHDLASQEEAADYILEMLSRHEGLLKYIKGVHLHQSLTGEYVKNMLACPQSLPSDYWQRFSLSMEHVLAIDTHQPFTTPGVNEILKKISPEYLTLEFTSSSRESHAEKLAAQVLALGWK